MKHFVLIFCFIAVIFNALASDSVLHERLKKVQVNDYIVTESNKMVNVLAVREANGPTLILEEISAPASSLDPRPASWSSWVQAKAPGHTSWSMIEIDLSNHELIECYSFSRSAWVDLSAQDSLVSTLLNLPLKKIPASDERRIGPEPANGEADVRKIWKPPFIEDGKPLHQIKFDVFSADWPDDGSELSGNRVSLYFDDANRCPFPVWIQIDTAHASVSSHMIDSGKNLPVVYRSMPRRIPEFIDKEQRINNGLCLTLKCPKYYRSFELYAVDTTSHEKQICPITHSLVRGEGELLQIEIDQPALDNVLEPNHRYTWLIVPSGHSECYSESRKPFLWKGE